MTHLLRLPRAQHAHAARQQLQQEVVDGQVRVRAQQNAAARRQQHAHLR
jgi:hypothetical protein